MVFNMKEIHVVPLKVIEDIIEKYPNENNENLELYISYDEEIKKFIVLDNIDKCCFIEEFNSLLLAFLYLLRESNINLTLLNLIDLTSKCFKTRIKKCNSYLDSDLKINF